MGFNIVSKRANVFENGAGFFAFCCKRHAEALFESIKFLIIYFFLYFPNNYQMLFHFYSYLVYNIFYALFRLVSIAV